MMHTFKHNHYVPEWYQRRFIPPEQSYGGYYYMDLNPGSFTDPRGVVHPNQSVRKRGFSQCFAQDDLYTINLSNVSNREIEQYFFGKIDRGGISGVEYFTNFEHPSVEYEPFNKMLIYLSTQKLRTPKGLNWLSNKIKSNNKYDVMSAMVKLGHLHCATWTECIWLIADAHNSKTKFIISDHPVTVYNRICGPRSQWCGKFNDPDIWRNATHTIFPLSLEKILILTNLSWVRNPYQHEMSLRPNPNPLRSAMFKYTDIQTLRHLTEQEVIDINYIIKNRALRYIAAAEEEWLYPERKVSTKKWNEFGHGYLLMPDPRPINIGGELYIGHNDGTVSAYDEYGRRQWDEDFGVETKNHAETKTLYRFKGEFARLFGPYRRGRTFDAMRLDNEFDDEDFHKYHLELEKKYIRHRKKSHH